MTKSCPNCGAPASGRFCAECGASLEVERICECGNRIPTGGKFCNLCGRPAVAVAGGINPAAGVASVSRAAASSPIDEAASHAAPAAGQGAGSRLPWAIGAIAAVLIIAVILLSQMGDDPAPAVATAPESSAAGDPRNIDLGSMTPDDAAIRLFTRVMTLAEAGDTAQARTFAPMAIAAYQLVPELTLDYRYDIAMIHFVNGEPEAAAAQADTILGAAPTHLFGLAAAAEAADRMGDTEKARDYYQRFLDSYDSEVANNSVAYENHPPLPAAMRMAAIAYLGGD